ncbi:MAG: S1/P1 nuclease, partial [Bacteroidaceae bacterium]|nr:S1/P1 nuclease [Bacteroidaceae bacterium]
IVTARTAQIEKLKTGKLSHEEAALALKMVIHFVGDLHQPMHLGHKSDLGGNTLKIKFFGTESNLLTVWDTDLVEAAHKWSYTEWMEQIDRADKRGQRRMTNGTIDDWARETHNLATEVYAMTPAGTDISYDYVANAAPIIEQQLLKAGLRLARILNEIY